MGPKVIWSRSHKRLASLVLAWLCSLPALADADHEALLRAYLEAWNTGDLDSLDSIVSDDFVRHGYGSANSRAELRQLISGFHGFYRDLRIELEDTVAGQTKGAMRWRFSGGFGDTSFEIESLNFAMYHFSEGRISEEWVYGNTSDFWRGMGYRIMPPGTRMVPPALEEPPASARRASPDFGVAELAAYAEATRRRKTDGAGQLEIGSEVACRLALDGASVGGLAAGSSVALRLAAGTHVVEATSLGGSVFFRRAVEIEQGEAGRLRIEAPGRVVFNLRDRTTEDLASGLMWQMADNGGDITKTAAETYCRDLEQGGHEDWRLPTIYELQEIYSPEAAGTKRFHTIDGIHLTGCCPWTSSPHGDFYWTFIFYNGLRYIKHDSIGKFSRALCVRDAA